MDKARFMGRMTATASHDLCNVLATIQQASGLLGDYLALARKETLKSMGLRPKFKYNDKFDEIIKQIQSQVDRGQNICEHLSYLAHSPDEDQGETDLTQAAKLLVNLCGRVAKKHKVALSVAPTPGSSKAAKGLKTAKTVVTMIEVLTALEAALLGVLRECREQGDIVFELGEAEGGVHVDILCQMLGPAEAKALVEALAGSKSGPYTAGVIQGGVRLAFEKAGR
jgi:signal transduction histidine kinase